MGGQDSFIGQLLGNANLFAPEQIAQTIDLVVEHGVKRGASDIHIEPQERVAVVRYRVDGTLHGAQFVLRRLVEPNQISIVRNVVDDPGAVHTLQLRRNRSLVQPRSGHLRLQ